MQKNVSNTASPDELWNTDGINMEVRFRHWSSDFLVEDCIICWKSDFLSKGCIFLHWRSDFFVEICRLFVESQISSLRAAYFFIESQISSLMAADFFMEVKISLLKTADYLLKVRFPHWGLHISSFKKMFSFRSAHFFIEVHSSLLKTALGLDHFAIDQQFMQIDGFWFLAKSSKKFFYRK